MELPSVILISPPSYKSGEIDLICKFFDEGLMRYHLRKPNFSIEEIYEFLEKVPTKYLSKIVVHRYPEILKDFDLGGYHFRSNEPVIDVRGISSRSLHKIDELVQLKENFEYVFLGPVFRSISKKGYGPKISLNQIFSVLKNDSLNHLSKKPNVYALGGIRKKKMIRLAEVGFSGVALLGAVWGSSDPLRALKEFLSMGSYFPSS